MKILHLTDERWDSGLTHYALQIAALQKADGHAVVLGVRPGKKPEQLARAQGLATGSVDSLPTLRRLIHSQAWDVINVHTGRMHSWALVFAPRSIPLIRTRGDARPVRVNPISRFMIRKTAAVIAASAHIASLYEQDFGMDEKRLHVIYPSITADPAFVPPPSGRVGILGRLDPVKGHADFLEAAARVLASRPQTKFVIAGKEANIAYSLLENQSRELGIASSIEYVGFQPSAPDFMRGCSLGVIASVGSEEISRACLEWMAVGRPVVGTLVGCLPELIEPEETGLLVPPGDGEAMGAAILRMLENPSRAEAWGKNAADLIRQKFGPQLQLEKTLDVYRQARP